MLKEYEKFDPTPEYVDVIATAINHAAMMDTEKNRRIILKANISLIRKAKKLAIARGDYGVVDQCVETTKNLRGQLNGSA